MTYPVPIKECAAQCLHARHVWVDSATWAGGANVATYDCPGRTGWPQSALDVALAERDHARAEWHRHNERADAFRAELADLRVKIAALIAEARAEHQAHDVAPFVDELTTLLGSQEPGELA